MLESWSKETTLEVSDRERGKEGYKVQRDQETLEEA